MIDKTVIITGGNSGLGYECAKEMAASQQAWHIIIACRNLQKASAAVDSLIAQSPRAKIEAMPIDLTSLASVRNFARDFRTRDLPPLRALVCNAGIQVVSGTTYTQDGFETTFGVNHLGHFLLTHLLLKLFVAPARIVMVSSDTHDPLQKTGMPEPHYDSAASLACPEKSLSDEDTGKIGRQRYTTSKLCNVYLTYELSRRLQDDGLSTIQNPISVNAFNPGLMPGTGLARDYSPLQRFAWHFILPVIRPIAGAFISINSAGKSGKALARLLLDPAVESVSGKYFSGMLEIKSSQESYDRQKAIDLWETSMKLVKLTQEETPLSILHEREST